MSDEIPRETDTPPDHRVVALELDPATLPEWWERILEIAPEWVRRMSVAEYPEGWYVRAEVHQDRVEGFYAALGEAWAEYQATVRARSGEAEGEE